MKTCESCGEPIAAKRLAAVPTATRCVVCQSARDLDPREVFGERLERVQVVESEPDGGQFRIGADSWAW